MTRRVKHNINDYIWVKITPDGEKIYSDYWHRYDEVLDRVGYKTPPLEKDADGWTKFQMWSFMEMFGQHLHIGMGGPIETNVEIEVEE